MIQRKGLALTAADLGSIKDIMEYIYRFRGEGAIIVTKRLSITVGVD